MGNTPSAGRSPGTRSPAAPPQAWRARAEQQHPAWSEKLSADFRKCSHLSTGSHGTSTEPLPAPQRLNSQKNASGSFLFHILLFHIRGLANLGAVPGFVFWFFWFYVRTQSLKNKVGGFLRSHTTESATLASNDGFKLLTDQKEMDGGLLFLIYIII